MFNVGDKVLVNQRFVATIENIESVDVDSIYEDGLKYFVQYCDAKYADYMSSTSLSPFIQ